MMRSQAHIADLWRSGLVRLPTMNARKRVLHVFRLLQLALHFVSLDVAAVDLRLAVFLNRVKQRINVFRNTLGKHEPAATPSISP